jgi:ubiquinone biosynthesis protein COQ9
LRCTHGSRNYRQRAEQAENSDRSMAGSKAALHLAPPAGWNQNALSVTAAKARLKCGFGHG